MDTVVENWGKGGKLYPRDPEPLSGVVPDDRIEMVIVIHVISFTRDSRCCNFVAWNKREKKCSQTILNAIDSFSFVDAGLSKLYGCPMNCAIWLQKRKASHSVWPPERN